MRPIVLLTCSGATMGPAGDVRAPFPYTPPDSAASPAGAPPTVKPEYILSVLAAGGTPLLLPNSADGEAIDAALSKADGLLLTGGIDICPERYGQVRHASVAKTDPARDETEVLAIHLAMRRKLPMLGICRGIQMLNVALGGRLIQDIPTCHQPVDPGEPIRHGNCEHGIGIEASSLPAGVLGCRQLIVNSTHHQALADVAGPLRAAAWSPDGIIEAVQSSDGYPLLGLQCHPERLWQARPEFLRPFAWLIST